jgi:cation transport protein ChaC
MYKNGLWVFGYGSLIWNPGFEFEQKQLATLKGYRRAFCMWSVHYRGDESCPGLVLGLDKSEAESCQGVAYFIAPDKAEAAHVYLRERELVSYAYLEQRCALELKNGEQVNALCYVIDRSHSQYAKGLDLAAQAAVIAQASGTKGPNRDYLFSTSDPLAELGIADKNMVVLSEMVKAS